MSLCDSCMGLEEELVRLECEHQWCKDCIVAAFETSTNETSYPVRCCSALPFEEFKHLLPESLAETLNSKIAEFETPIPDRVYCSNRECSAFIPRTNMESGIATCSCTQKTCILCKEASHDGDCSQDQEFNQVLALAEEKGWGRCPPCGRIIERNGGCPHLSCPCGHQFCLFCSRDWSVCAGSCTGAIEDQDAHDMPDEVIFAIDERMVEERFATIIERRLDELIRMERRMEFLGWLNEIEVMPDGEERLHNKLIWSLSVSNYMALRDA